MPNERCPECHSHLRNLRNKLPSDDYCYNFWHDEPAVPAPSMSTTLEWICIFCGKHTNGNFEDLDNCSCGAFAWRRIAVEPAAAPEATSMSELEANRILVERLRFIRKWYVDSGYGTPSDDLVRVHMALIAALPMELRVSLDGRASLSGFASTNLILCKQVNCPKCDHRFTVEVEERKEPK